MEIEFNFNGGKNNKGNSSQFIVKPKKIIMYHNLKSTLNVNMYLILTKNETIEIFNEMLFIEHKPNNFA